MSSDLVLNERLSDVILKVRHEGFSWRVPAHSLLLTHKSITFQDMLDERTEAENPVTLSVVGMKPETAVAVLKYIYEDERPADVTADLLIAANKYRLQPLKDHLEERLLADMTVRQACTMWEELQQRQAMELDCRIRAACQELVESHAFTVFGSDLVMLLQKMTLTRLLQSDRLNIPDEAYVFWGIWRWGRRQCSMLGRSLEDREVLLYLDDLFVLIRKCSVRRCEGIPAAALSRFDRCRMPRTRYIVPQDMLKQSCSFTVSATWEDIVRPKCWNEDGTLCLMLSFEKDSMLVGVTLEVCADEPKECFLRLFREFDKSELRRERICWCRTALRRTNTRGETDSRLEATITFREPAFLERGAIYSLYMLGSFSMVWGSFQFRRKRIENNFVNFHGEGVTSVREVHVVPDVTVTWGSRGSST